MTVAEFYTKTNYALRGTDEDSPTHGDDEADFWISLLNSKKDDLYQDVAKNWSYSFSEDSPNEPGTVATTGTTTLTGTSTFFTDYKVGDTVLVSGETVRTIATITSNTVLTVSVAFSNTASAKTFTHANIISSSVTEYALPRSFLGLSGDGSTIDGVGSGVYVLTTAGDKRFIPVIEIADRNENVRSVYIAEHDPQKLFFADTIDSTEDIVGGTLKAPGYYLPADLTAETDILPFLDANWAVFAVASEVAFADITYEDKAADLNAKANDLYAKMVSRNRGQLKNTPKPLKYNIKRIGQRIL